jgi:hypothetical protein
VAGTGSGDTRTPTQARADALADLLAAARANTRPLGVSGLSILVDVEALPGGIGSALDDGQPLGPATFDLWSCAAACAVIFGMKRDDTFVPLSMGRPDLPRPRLHPLRTIPTLLRSPPHPALAPRRFD